MIQCDILPRLGGELYSPSPEFLTSDGISRVPLKDAAVSTEDRYLFTLYSAADPSFLFEYALQTVLALTEASAGSLFIWDEYQKQFILKAIQGPYRDRVQTQVKFHEGIFGKVAEHGSPVLVKDIGEDERFQFLERRNHYRSSSFICLPLVARNKLLGIMNLTEKEDLSCFNEENLRTAQDFAMHAALAYENLRALMNLREENADLHRLRLTSLEGRGKKSVRPLKETL